MLEKFNSSLEVLQDAISGKLYKSLVRQLNKDMALANVSLVLPQEVRPQDLKSALHEKVYFLLLERFSDYLNLLYVIDVPEKAVVNARGRDIVEVAEEVTFLILKREWQKVWLKAKYKS
jgi:hypothetical protein